MGRDGRRDRRRGRPMSIKEACSMMNKDGQTFKILKRYTWFAINYLCLWISSILLFVRSLEVLMDDGSGYSSYTEYLYFAWIVVALMVFLIETVVGVLSRRRSSGVVRLLCSSSSPGLTLQLLAP